MDNNAGDAGASASLLGARHAVARVCELLEWSGGAEVRTARGSWRAVVAVYSDHTLGTVRAGENRAGGRFTIVDADTIAEVRPRQRTAD